MDNRQDFDQGEVYVLTRDGELRINDLVVTHAVPTARETRVDLG